MWYQTPGQISSVTAQDSQNPGIGRIPFRIPGRSANRLDGARSKA
jgi:hypothetical protein